MRLELPWRQGELEALVGGGRVERNGTDRRRGGQADVQRGLRPRHRARLRGGRVDPLAQHLELVRAEGARVVRHGTAGDLDAGRQVVGQLLGGGLRQQLQPEVAPPLVSRLDAVEGRHLRRRDLDHVRVGDVGTQVEAALLRAPVAEVIRAVMPDEDRVLDRLPGARVGDRPPIAARQAGREAPARLVLRAQGPHELLAVEADGSSERRLREIAARAPAGPEPPASMTFSRRASLAGPPQRGGRRAAPTDRDLPVGDGERVGPGGRCCRHERRARIEQEAARARSGPGLLRERGRNGDGEHEDPSRKTDRDAHRNPSSTGG